MAPRTFHVLLTCLLCLLRTGNGQDGPTTITVTPATLTMMPNVSDSTGGQVTISCRASSVGAGDIVTVINIQRVLHASPNAPPVEVVVASLSNTDAVLKLTSLQGSATVSGGLTDKSITLILNRANCGDAGMYICNAYAVVGTDNNMYTSSRNLTTEVSPGSITMTTEPSGVNNWRVNDTLLMRCNGVVGTVQDDSQVEWIWEYQDGNRFAGGENWQPYSDIGDPSADIQTNSSPTTSSCFKRQISVLTRHLTLDDTDREYRCYVINNEMSVNQNAQANAQVISVGTVSESGVAPTAPTISSGSVIQTTQPVAMPMRTTTDVAPATPTISSGSGNGQDGPTTITVTPATLTLMPSASDGTGGQVTISCWASSVGDDEIMTVINIQRVLHASPNAAPVLVAAASLANTDAVLVLTSLQGSATVSGSLTDKTITLILNRANCVDAGMYICTANSVSGTANNMYTSSRNLTIEGVVPTTPGISSGSVTTTTVSTETDKSKDDRLKTCDCPDVGVVIGAVVAVLIVIDVVILAVVIIVLKRRTMGPAAQTMSEETRGNVNQTSSLGDVSRPVEQRPVTTAENPNTYDGLILRDVGVASLYQDLGSPYELPR